MRRPAEAPSHGGSGLAGAPHAGSPPPLAGGRSIMILVRSFLSPRGPVIVCSCFNVSDRAVRELARGGASLAETLAATRAGASCGACRLAVARIHAGAPAAPPPCRRGMGEERRRALPLHDAPGAAEGLPGRAAAAAA